jgi:hypothetical protein
MKSPIFWDIKASRPLEIKRAVLVTCFDAGFLLGLCFDPKFGGDMFLRNVG